MRRIAREHPQNAPLEGKTVDLALAISGEARKPLRMLLSTMLFDVTPNDPPTLLACSTMLFAVALAAMIVPARNATRVDPVVAMRCD